MGLKNYAIITGTKLPWNVHLQKKREEDLDFLFQTFKAVNCTKHFSHWRWKTQLMMFRFFNFFFFFFLFEWEIHMAWFEGLLKGSQPAPAILIIPSLYFHRKIFVERFLRHARRKEKVLNFFTLSNFAPGLIFFFTPRKKNRFISFPPLKIGTVKILNGFSTLLQTIQNHILTIIFDNIIMNVKKL